MILRQSARFASRHVSASTDHTDLIWLGGTVPPRHPARDHRPLFCISYWLVLVISLALSWLGAVALLRG